MQKVQDYSLFRKYPQCESQELNIELSEFSIGYFLTWVQVIIPHTRNGSM